jgi:hypothetical protein
MNAKQRIAELERQLAEVSRVDLVRVEGKACEIVEHTFLKKGETVYDYGSGHRWVPAIPVLVVKEREG